jgi:hypothetical protein
MTPNQELESDEIKFKVVKMPMAVDFTKGSAWEYRGDPARTDGYTVIGEDEDGEERALVAYDSLSGASSQSLSEGIPGEWIMDRPKAEELHDRIQAMDQVYWPGFNPTLVRVEKGQVVERFTPPKSELGSE